MHYLCHTVFRSQCGSTNQNALLMQMSTEHPRSRGEFAVCFGGIIIMINKIHQRRRGVPCFLDLLRRSCAFSLSLHPSSYAPLNAPPLRLSVPRWLLVYPPESRARLPVLHANLEAHCLAILGELLSRCIISVFDGAHGFCRVRDW